MIAAIARPGEEVLVVSARPVAPEETPPIVFGGIGLTVLLIAWTLAMTAHVARLDARPDVLSTTDAVILTPTVVGTRSCARVAADLAPVPGAPRPSIRGERTGLRP